MSTYLDKILKQFKMEQSKKEFLPMLQGVKLIKTQSPTTVEDRKRMKGYPQWNKDMFLDYGGDKRFVVKGYIDASFDTNLDDSKS